MKKLLLFFAIIGLASTPLLAQKIKILTNQVGYNPAAFKTAVVEAYPGDVVSSAHLIRYDDDKPVTAIKPVKAGPVDQWKNWVFWTLDFSPYQHTGKYYIECRTNRGIIDSYPFLIQENALERHTISDVVAYFKEQRSVGQNEKADKHMTFEGDIRDTLDVHGGWADASGDYGKHLSHLSFTKFFDPQQIPMVVYSLEKSYQMLKNRNNVNFTQILKRMRDELLYGADYLVRVKDPDGSFYRSVSAPGPGKKPEDRRLAPAMTGFQIKTKKTDSAEPGGPQPKTNQRLRYEVGFRNGGGIAVAALAIASRFRDSGDYSSAEYLKSAEDAFNYIEAHNSELDQAGSNNIIDDYCALAAATELYKATHNSIYKEAADKRAASLMNRLATWGKYKNYWRANDGGRPFFHAVDAGFPVVSLVEYLDICDTATRQNVLDVVKKSLEFELAVTSEVPNAFGYARQLVQHKDGKRNTSFFYPHDTETAPWWQGEDARLASLAAAARLAAPYFKDEPKFRGKLEKYADDQLNWILGLNPYDDSMMYGVGHNNTEYGFFGTWQYSNMPGGISNGITSGLTNPHGIAFAIPYSVTHKDEDWRWEEQWLPHDSWFLLAVSAGE